MESVCRTCSGPLSSWLSREHGQCGACRTTEEALVDSTPPEEAGKNRVSPWHSQTAAPDTLRKP